MDKENAHEKNVSTVAPLLYADFSWKKAAQKKYAGKSKEKRAPEKKQGLK